MSDLHFWVGMTRQLVSDPDLVKDMGAYFRANGCEPKDASIDLIITAYQVEKWKRVNSEFQT
jgi:hypothetical protein